MASSPTTLTLRDKLAEDYVDELDWMRVRVLIRVHQEMN